MLKDETVNDMGEKHKKQEPNNESLVPESNQEDTIEVDINVKC